jgi:hypothetical protein
MNDRQQYALEHPIENAFDTAAISKYVSVETLGRLTVKKVLTVEPTESGEYQWHASISVLATDGTPMDIYGGEGDLEKFEGKSVVMRLKDMLDGVGEAQISTIPPGPVLHMFKKLTAAESVRVNKYSILKN